MYLYSIYWKESVTSHGARSDRIITITKQDSGWPFRVIYASYNTSLLRGIQIGSYYLRNSSSDSYTALYSAIKHRFIMVVSQKSSSHYISFSYLNSESIRYYQVNQTNAIAINADANSSQAELYYSYAYYSRKYLARGRIDNSSSYLYNSTSYNIGSSNCANLIEVKDNIVAIS